MEYIDKLPLELLEIIFNHIPNSYKIFINKEFYIKYNGLIVSRIGNFQSYMRDIIRFDCVYPFTFILNRNLHYWISTNKFTFNKIVYDNFLSYLMEYARKNKANKCLNILNLELQLSKLKKLNCNDYKQIKKSWIQ